MKSYKDITNKYLNKNKKRTILTICGVILSVALITSIGLFIKCMQNTFINDEISKKGSFHLQMVKNGEKDYERLKNNPKIDKIGLKQNLSNVNLRNSKKIGITKYNKSAFDLLPYKLLEGQFPKSEAEIVLEPWILKYIPNNPKVGDRIKLKIDKGEMKEFTICGLINNDSLTQFNGTGLGMTYSDKFDISKSTIYVKVSPKADISDTVSTIKSSFKNVTTNSMLLTYMGEGESKGANNELYKIATIVIGIAVIATIAVIYNSFQISVVERIKQYGLLRAVGATPKQIKQLVLREASIISLVGVPLGILFGVLAIFIVGKIFSIMSDSIFEGFKIIIPYYVLIISGVIGVIAIYVSALIPARFAGKISPLTAISSRTSITKEKIKRNRGRIAKRFLGINSLMAFKNIKRNRKRFNITVFSIMISVIIFIAFSSFINLSEKFTDDDSESYNSHFIITSNLNKKGKTSLSQDTINKIKNNDCVKQTFLYYGNYGSKALIPSNKKDKGVEDFKPQVYENVKFKGKDMTSLGMSFDIYDETKLESSKKYVKKGKVDEEQMVKENGVVLVKNNLFKSKGKYYEGPITNLKVGDSFYVNKNIFYKKTIMDEGYNDNKSNEQKFKNISNNSSKDMIKLKVSAIMDDPPYDAFFNKSHLMIIAPKKVIENISGEKLKDMPIVNCETILKDEKMDSKFENWIQPIADTNGFKAVNIVKQNKQTKASMLQIKILMYGFIVVISLIGAVNIINTITTNLILRKKEIASLSAIGMTYKNIRSMVLTEGILYGLYGCFYGGIIGSVLSYMLSQSFIHLKGFEWGIPWGTIAIATLAAVGIGLLSVIKPLNKIKKENVIDVIRLDA